MKDEVVVDTNVAVVANGDAQQVSIACQFTCISELVATLNEKVVLLDTTGAILAEYMAQKPHGYPRGAGDLFIVWIYDNQANPDRCKQIAITPLPNDRRMFDEFPNDRALTGFDPSDCKFVAVALASGNRPPIVHATDRGWRNFAAQLERHDVFVKNICPGDLKP